MEIKINISDNIVSAIYALAAAIEGMGTKMITEAAPVEVVEEPAEADAPVVEKAAPVVEELPEKVDPVWTKEEVIDKVTRLLKVDSGKYSADVRGALTQCGAERLGTLSGCNYPAFMDLLADLFIKEGI